MLLLPLLLVLRPAAAGVFEGILDGGLVLGDGAADDVFWASPPWFVVGRGRGPSLCTDLHTVSIPPLRVWGDADGWVATVDIYEKTTTTTTGAAISPRDFHTPPPFCIPMKKSPSGRRRVLPILNFLDRRRSYV